MDTLKMRWRLRDAREAMQTPDANPIQPALSSMLAVADLLDEHAKEHEELQAQLSILSNEKPGHRCVRCGESAQYGRIYCERCVASRTTGNLDALKPPSAEPDEGEDARHEVKVEPEPGDFHTELAAASLDEVARLRSQVEGDAGLIRYLWRAKEDVAERHARLVGASGEWNVERAGLCAQVERLQREQSEHLAAGLCSKCRAKVTLERGPNSRLTIYGETYVIHPVVGEEIARLRRELKGANVERGRWSVERARQEGLDEGIARSWEAAAKDLDTLSKGEEESKGEGGGSGTAQEPGAPASPTAGAGDREASSPTLVCSQCGKAGSHFVPPSLGESGFYVCDPKEVVQGRQGRQESVGREPAETRPGIEPPALRPESLSPGTEGGCASSSPAAPGLREEVMAFMDCWGVGTGTTCGDAVSEVLDAWEAQHRALRKAARAMCEEAPKSVHRLIVEGFPGHASILEAAANRLQDALKEADNAAL